jgi:arylsulfatase A-like enzyme
MYAGSDLLARVGSPGKREAIRSTRDFTVYSADDPEVAYMKALYKAEVTYTDHYVGVLLDHLDQLGLAGHTLVVLTADHGQSLFEHDYVGHSGALYEQTIDVPLIFRGPHLIPAGKRVDGLVQSVDIVPTILDLLGMKPMEEVQGVSLAGRIRGMETPGEGNRPAYFETLHATSPAARYRGLSVDGWKLIRSEDGSVERLYRIDGDPGELEDLYRADSRKAAEMDSLLDDLIVKIRSGSQGKRLSIDRGTREILRSLGYVW